MKKTFILLAVLAASVLTHAQKLGAQGVPKNAMKYQGYTIHILPAMAGTYCYDISKDGSLLLHQSRNPFNGSPIGLATRDDAYKVARWQIDHLIPNEAPQVKRSSGLRGFEKWPAVLPQRFNNAPTPPVAVFPRPPLNVARQLGLRLHKL